VRLRDNLTPADPRVAIRHACQQSSSDRGQAFCFYGFRIGESRRVPIDNPELLFPNYDRGGMVVSLGDLQFAFSRALKDAGITNFRLLDLRHTFASHDMLSGGNLYAPAMIPGQKDIEKT
jgi:integrase